MATTITPNMNLIVPTPGQEQGPTYATDINNSLTLIDQHSHIPGQGVPITPAGLSISTDLSFISNNATLLRSVRFSPQSAPLAGATDLGCLYENGVDLYYNDGSGNVIRITQSGAVAGASGSITGLASPASVVYSALSGVFTFQSNTNVAAGLSTGPLTIHDVATSANGIGLVSPTGLASNYTITLPGATPSSTLPVVMNNSGNLSTTTITGSMVGSNTIAASSLVNNSITDTQISPSSISGSSLVGNIDLGGPNVTAGSRQVLVQHASTSPTGMSVLRGTISAGGIVNGEGFTLSVGGGVYTITFNTNFSATPVVVATGLAASSGTGIFATVFGISTSGFSVQTSNFSGFGSYSFTFMVIGIG